MSNTIATSIDVRARAQLLGMEPLSDFLPPPRRLRFGSQFDRTHPRGVRLPRFGSCSPRGASKFNCSSPPIPIRTRVFKSADWAAPTIFIGAQLWSQNPLAVQLALKILQSYVVGLLKSATDTQPSEIVLRCGDFAYSRRYRQLTYEGPPSGISEIAQTLRDMSNE